MMGGATNRAPSIWPRARCSGRVTTNLREIMGITVEPDFVRIFRHQQAIPQYAVGHSRRLGALDERLAAIPGLFVTGNAFYGIGLNDCVNASNQVAERVCGFIGKNG